MNPRSWFPRLFAHTPRNVRKAPARFQPCLEALENRIVPTGELVLGATPTDPTDPGTVIVIGPGDPFAPPGTVIIGPGGLLSGPVVIGPGTLPPGNVISTSAPVNQAPTAN